MRVFFALPLPAKSRDALDRWRRQNLLAEGRQVPAANFHVTLCFLGNLEEPRLSAVVDAADRISADRFDLVLNTPGYFPRPRVYWVGPQVVPKPLAALAETLSHTARRLGIAVDRRPYRPHLTLLRKCREPASPPLKPPDIRLDCDRFCLMASHSGTDGVHYAALRSWDLG